MRAWLDEADDTEALALFCGGLALVAMVLVMPAMIPELSDNPLAGPGESTDADRVMQWLKLSWGMLAMMTTIICVVTNRESRDSGSRLLVALALAWLPLAVCWPVGSLIGSMAAP